MGVDVPHTAGVALRGPVLFLSLAWRSEIDETVARNAMEQSMMNRVILELEVPCHFVWLVFWQIQRILSL